MNNERIYWYEGYTLVDITNTGVTKFAPNVAKERNQQRNWESILQILGLRTQIFEINQSYVNQPVRDFEFGSMYKGKHNIWTFRFSVEFENLYGTAENPVDVLEKDFEQTPMIVGLDETAKFPMSLLYTSGEAKNIYFKILPDEVNNSVVDA